MLENTRPTNSRLAVLLLACFVVGTSCTALEAAPGIGERTNPGNTQHTVQPGETLYKIADRHCSSPEASVQTIFERNSGTSQSVGGSLRSVDQIEPGWTLEVVCAGASEASSGAEPWSTRTPSELVVLLAAVSLLAMTAIGLLSRTVQRRSPRRSVPVRSGRQRTAPAVRSASASVPTPRLGIMNPGHPNARNQPGNPMYRNPSQNRAPSLMSPSHPNARNTPGNPMHRPPQSFMQKQMRNPMSPMSPTARYQPGNPMYRRR